MSALIWKSIKYQSHEPLPCFREGVIVDSFITDKGLNYVVISKGITEQILASDLIEVKIEGGIDDH